MAMQSITFQDKQGIERKYSTNPNGGGGVFILKNGAYQQLRGNMQTPSFKDAEQFERYIRANFPKPGRVVSQSWD